LRSVTAWRSSKINLGEFLAIAEQIYTDVEPYRGFIRNGIDGVLLDNDPGLWARTIMELAADTPRRRQMAAAARQRASEMAWLDADPSWNR
jgi:hypothetical protein